MKKDLLIVLSLIVLTTIKAQIWCPPGAQWHYTRYYGPYTAYAKHTFVNTVTINSLTCQEINYYSQYYSQMNNAVNTYSTNIYTHVNNNILYLLDPNSNNFDTLFNFNAVIGSKWGLPNKSTVNCSKSRVLVTDTGHNVIQGVNLKWFKVTLTSYVYNWPNPVTANDTIYERLGCLTQYFFGSEDVCPTITDATKGGPLRCYSDNQIINYKRYSGLCNDLYIPTTIKEYLTEIKLQVYPIPANDVLNIDMIELPSSEKSIIKIKDLLGKTVLENELNKQINIKDLKPGIYFLHFYNQEKLIAMQKIIKQ